MKTNNGLQRKRKKFFKSLSNSHISLSFLTHLPNGNDKYVHTLRSFLENHTQFQTKMGKVYTRFRTKTAEKPYPMGRHIPIWLIKGSTPRASLTVLEWVTRLLLMLVLHLINIHVFVKYHWFSTAWKILDSILGEMNFLGIEGKCSSFQFQTPNFSYGVQYSCDNPFEVT